MLGVDRFLRWDPRVQVGVLLSAFAVFAFLGLAKAEVLLHLITVVVFSLVVDFLFAQFKRRPIYFPRAALVTGLLIGLIHDWRAPMSMSLATVVLAIASKHLLRVGGKHLFNPAVFGLVVSSALFGGLISWWGPYSAPVWTLVLLLLGEAVVLFRLKSLFMPLGFLLVYGVYLALRVPGQVLSGVLDPSILLFSWVMLPEYKTSPIIGNWRYVFGLLVGALFLVFLEIFQVVFADPVLVALLASNAVSFLFIRVMSQLS